MKALVFNLEGESSGLAWKMQKEGCQVDLYVPKKEFRRQMEGLVPHVETIEEGLKNKPDFIVFDLNGEGKKADSLRKDGWKVVNGSELADKLEFDRAYGIKVCQQYGIKTPKTTEFKNVDDASAFVKKNNKAYAVKMDSRVGGEASSYVAKDAEDMLDYLAQQKESGKINGAEFIIQEVVKGAEISTEVWFSNGEPVWPANSTLEDKHLLAGGLGARTGCETSLVYHYEGTHSKIVDKTIRKLFPLLKYAKYTGCIDVNCIVSEDDHEPYFLEFTPRLGYSAIYAYMAILGVPISEYFSRIARGSAGAIPFKTLWGSSLRLSIPPYPTQIEPPEADAKTYGLQEGVRVNGKYGPDFIPVDVMKGKKTDLMCSGTNGIVGECLGRGSSILEAWRASQRVFKSVEVPNAQGRYVDGVEDIWKRVLKLKQYGYDVPKPISGEAGRSSTPLTLKASPV